MSTPYDEMDPDTRSLIASQLRQWAHQLRAGDRITAEGMLPVTYELQDVAHAGGEGLLEITEGMLEVANDLEPSMEGSCGSLTSAAKWDYVTHDHNNHETQYPVPAGLERKPGVEYGCGAADCEDCYRIYDAGDAPSCNDMTREQILELRDEATAAGDEAQVKLCDSALRGDQAAWSACTQVIWDARAMHDGDDWARFAVRTARPINPHADMARLLATLPDVLTFLRYVAHGRRSAHDAAKARELLDRMEGRS
jgi:hypothetical protein